MLAFLLKHSGKPEVLKMQDVPEPDPAKKEVKVKIGTIGINYAETLSRRGQYSWAPRRPYIPGMEAYGEIVSIGDHVTKYKVGDKVIIGQQYGNYAEFTCVEEHLCFPAIEHFSEEENAAFLVNYMTAWIALKRLCRVEKGEVVLIHAAAGGVGTAAVQLAKKLGCFVYGTASSTSKLALIEELGADRTINYTTEDFFKHIAKEKGGVDCVLEVVGGDVFKKSVQLLKPFGRIAVIGFASINLHWWKPWTIWKTWRDAPKFSIMKMARGSQGFFASHIGYLTADMKVTAEVWEELKSFVNEHGLKPIVGHTFPFEDLPQAHALMESRASSGKIVVKI